MLRQVAEGVLVHQSEFLQSNGVVVQGRTGALLIDPGIRDVEVACLVKDLGELGQPVAAGFATHPHWDHVLWDAGLGTAPRYGTAHCAATVRDELSNPDFKARITEHLAETEIAGQVPLELYGLVSGLPAATSQIPWDGPRVRIIEHRGHAPGHAALLIEEEGVLVAGDMLSDVLVPMLDLDATEPIADYLAGLELLEEVADEVLVVVPGHGSVGGAGQARERIGQDRAYLHGLRDGYALTDPRIGSSAKPGWEWVADVHEGQRQGLSPRGEDASPA